MTAAIESALRRLALRRRRLAAVRTMLAGAACVGAWVLGAMLIDRWLATPPRVRQATVAIAAAFAIWTVARVVRLVMTTRVELARAAAVAEALDPAWDERLSTLVTQAALPVDRRGSSSLLRATVDAVERELKQRPPAERATFAVVRPAGVAFAVVLTLWMAALAVPGVDVPRLLARQIRPRLGLPPVTSLRVEVLPHARTVRQGENLSITADVEGGDADAVLWAGPNAGNLTSTPMNRSYGNRFTTTLLAVQGDFVYRVTAGDASSGLTAVRVVRRPGVSRLDVTLIPPSGPATKRGESDGRLRVARGTGVNVVFRVTEPVRSATVAIGEKAIAATAEADGRTWRAEFIAENETAWSIELVGRRGQHGSGPAGMRIELADPK